MPSGYTYDWQHGPGVSGASAPVMSTNNSTDKVIQAVSSTPNVDYLRNVASTVQHEANFDPSEYGDMIRDVLSEYSSSASQNMDKYIQEMRKINDENTALSQEFAREQMEYQKQSDRYAMAWSAAEAQKNREYQERLANTAHQREVKDLIAAGLNPILAANNGAYTGSGSTGQAFSSSGAQGTVDTSVSGVMSGLVNGIMNSASSAFSAKLYTDAQKYSTDMQYAMAKLNADTNILMNQKNIDANKAINQLNNDYAIKNANIHSAATLGAAGMNAGAIQFSANKAAEAAIYGHNKSAETKLEEAKIHQETEENVARIKNESSPWGLVSEVVKGLMDHSLNNGSNPDPNTLNEYYRWLAEYMKEHPEEFDAVSGASPSVPNDRNAKKLWNWLRDTEKIPHS